MTRARRKWLVAALAIGIVILVIPIVRRFVGRQRARFPYAVGTLSSAAYAQLTARGWEAQEQVVAPGVSLNGIIRRPLAATAPWILFFPGNDAAQLATAQKFLELVRGESDWGLAVWSYRGFGSSGGVPEREALTGDATTIYDGLLAREHLAAARVHVVAFSLGGYLAVNAVGVASKAGKKPATLSLLAAVEDIVMVRPSWAQRLVTGDVYEIQPLLDAVPAPVLVVQGTEDEALGVEQGRKIAARLGARARYLELPGTGHNALLEAAPAIRAVRSMVDPSASR